MQSASGSNGNGHAAGPIQQVDRTPDLTWLNALLLATKQPRLLIRTAAFHTANPTGQQGGELAMMT